MIFAPLEGFRHVEVTNTRTSLDFAHICRDLVDVHFLNFACICIPQVSVINVIITPLASIFPSGRNTMFAKGYRFPKVLICCLLLTSHKRTVLSSPALASTLPFKVEDNMSFIC